MSHDNALPTRRDVLRLAWPVVLANVASPLLGFVDTAVIGHAGHVHELGAIALGALLFNFVFWSFGFLRMGTTGFTAQALGAGDGQEVRAALLRALLLALGFGLLLLALQWPIGFVAFRLFDASAEVEAAARHYFAVRIWGAPAALSLFAVTGHLIGSGRTRSLLALQFFMNGLNMLLDLLFAGALGWGVEGIALGTALSEWVTLTVALVVVARRLAREHDGDGPRWPLQRALDPARMVRTLRANADILVRTFTLLLGFAWFTNQGAAFGDATLAANHILLQLISFSAFFLDGYAYVAESFVGRALGSGRRELFDHAVSRTSELAVLTALGLALTVALSGGFAIRAFTDLPSVRAEAMAYLPWCVTYVLVSVAAFQLDGVFIGATATRDMRNAALVSAGSFVALGTLLVQRYENRGLWTAFVGYVVIRALTLLARYGAVRASVATAGPSTR
ncbi:MAG: MATE family efflux transporter [Polyangiales bacterium]|nr:MATE family efflux transporter [Myxococcales bacterium]